MSPVKRACIYYPLFISFSDLFSIRFLILEHGLTSFLPSLWTIVLLCTISHLNCEKDATMVEKATSCLDNFTLLAKSCQSPPPTLHIPIVTHNLLLPLLKHTHTMRHISSTFGKWVRVPINPTHTQTLSHTHIHTPTGWHKSLGKKTQLQRKLQAGPIYTKNPNTHALLGLHLHPQKHVTHGQAHDY